MKQADLIRFLEKLQQAGMIETLESAATSEDLAVLCGPYPNTVGSKQIKCDCGRLVWMSPTTQEMMEKRNGRPVVMYCPACVKERTKEKLDDNQKTPSAQ